MIDRMPTRDEIAKLITEDEDFNFEPAGGSPEPEAGPPMPGEEGDEYDPMGEEVEPITLDQSLLEMMLKHMLEMPEDGMAEALANAALEHSKVEPMEDPDSEGIMTGERDFQEILDMAHEAMGRGEEAPDMGGEEMPGEEMPGEESDEGDFPFESVKNDRKTIAEEREKFRKIV